MNNTTYQTLARAMLPHSSRRSRPLWPLKLVCSTSSALRHGSCTVAPGKSAGPVAAEQLVDLCAQRRFVEVAHRDSTMFEGR